METISFIALSKMTAMRRNLSVIANNMANLNTTGYQTETPIFKEYLVKTSPKNSISYVQDIGAWHDTTPGGFRFTGSKFDLAIKGDGYFSVQTQGGTKYTRNGHFTVDADGRIVTQNGQPLLSGGAPIIIGPNDKNIHISKDGVVSSENGQIGQIEVVDFDDKQGLKKEAGSLYTADATSPKTAENYSISQGYLETSNVKAVTEMTKMMAVTRSYETMKNAVDREDERVRQMIRTFSQTARQ